MKIGGNNLRGSGLAGVLPSLAPQSSDAKTRKETNNMNTKVLLLGAVVAAFAVTTLSAGPLLTPRAASNQIKHVTAAEGPAVTIAPIVSNSALLTPRAAGNQIKVVKGAGVEANPAVMCQKTMAGSPKAVAECTAHTTMPGCAALAMEK